MAFFSLFRRSAAELKDLRSLIGLALCMALGIVLEAIGTVQVLPELQLSFGFLTSALIGMLYGPFCGAVTGTFTDLIVFAIHPTGAYFPGFTLTSLLGGIVYGLFLYKKKCSLPRLILAKSSITLFLNILLNSFWLTILYNQAFWAMLPVRITKNLIMLPIEILLMWLVLPRVAKLAPTQSH